MRDPVVAGQFYPGSSEKLANKVDGMLHEAAELPVIGAVAPHAGYDYSGQVAAEVYSCLPKAETYVIIGPKHHRLGSLVALSRDSWSTPLGVVETDLELADTLTGGIIDSDETAHSPEHSLEVQIPFLQRRFANFKILPVCMGLQDMETAVEVGQEISQAIQKLRRKVVVIASSDFSHYEPQETARKVDFQLLEAILNMDVSELYNRVYRYDASACGYGPIAATIIASAGLGAKIGRLLRYATSGDVSGDYSQVVGYGAIVFC
jgi:hypothetical protein